MLNIRLARKGKKKQPIFRLLVCEKNKDPWGKYLENLGNYNPRSKELVLQADRLKYWLEKGAQPSDSVWNMLVEKGLVEGKKRTVTKISKKRLAKQEAVKTKEAPKAAPAEAVAEATAETEKPATPEVKAETITEAPVKAPEPNKAEEVKEAKQKEAQPKVEVSKEPTKADKPQTEKTPEKETSTETEK